MGNNRWAKKALAWTPIRRKELEDERVMKKRLWQIGNSRKTTDGIESFRNREVENGTAVEKPDAYQKVRNILFFY